MSLQPLTNATFGYRKGWKAECDSQFYYLSTHQKGALPGYTGSEETASSESGSLLLSSLSGERQLTSAMPDSWSLPADRQVSQDWSELVGGTKGLGCRGLLVMKPPV